MYFRALVSQCEVTPSSNQMLSCFVFLVAECKSRSHILFTLSSYTLAILGLLTQLFSPCYIAVCALPFTVLPP